MVFYGKLSLKMDSSLVLTLSNEKLRFLIICLPCKRATPVNTRTSVHAKRMWDFQKGIMVCPYMLLVPSSHLRLCNPSEFYNSSILPKKPLFTFQTANKGQIGFAVKPLVENLLNHKSYYRAMTVSP